MESKPPREEDELQPGATGSAEITRDITGETHVHPLEEDNPATRIYIVREGDTLGGIAERFYGNPMAYPRIVEANRDRLDENDWPAVGTELRIPL